MSKESNLEENATNEIRCKLLMDSIGSSNNNNNEAFAIKPSDEEKGKQINNDKVEADNTHLEEELNEHTSCLGRCFGPIRGGSLRGSTFAMASITFGGGCLAFPSVVAQCGPIIALFIFILCGACSYYTLKILLDDGVKAGIMDYNNLLEHATGKKMVIFSDINNIIMCIGVIMSYQLTVYKFALQLGNKYFDIDPDDKMNKLYLILFCFFVIQIPLSLLKNISTLQYASLVGTFSLVYSIIVIAAEMFFYCKNYLDAGNVIPWYVELNWNYLDTFSTFMFGFAAHNGIFQVFTELKRPTVIRYYKVLDRSFVIEVMLYLSIAFAGFFSTFKETKDVFLDRPDLPNFNDIFVQISKISLFICLHCTMAINYNIMRMSFKSFFFNNNEIPLVKDTLMVVFTYIISNLMVFYIKEVTQILGVIGGICTIVICVINPIVIHIKLSGKPWSHWENLMAYFIMIFVTVFGCMSTIKSLVQPFLQ